MATRCGHGHLQPQGGQQGALGEVVVAEEDGVDVRLAAGSSSANSSPPSAIDERLRVQQFAAPGRTGRPPACTRAPALQALHHARVELGGGKGDAALRPRPAGGG
jgi:hypothetical protein